eukprot:scaffold65731_cov32-Attheya_sp.AAC.2
MSNTVWVTWKDSSTDAMFYAKVIELEYDAEVVDLRRAFVAQQRLGIGPASLKVFENGEKLSEDKKLKDYFVPPADSAFLPAPGKIKDTALVVTLPPPQQQNKKRPAALSTESPPMKRHKSVEASKYSTIFPEGVIFDLPVQKLAILTPRKTETVRYFGRQGTAELFKELVDSKPGEDPFNVSLIGHPGAGKSNLVWAVAHHLVTKNKQTVLWASRCDVKVKWELRLFEHDGKTANVYELENAPEELSDILKEPLLKDLGVLILDAPTVSKSENPPSSDGVAAFEWAGKTKRIGARRVIHTSPLRAFSTDERILGEFWLYNKTMRPWTRFDFVEAMHDEALKAQVCETLSLDPADVTPEDVVDKKFFYSGINARWFFNFTIEAIKESSRNIIDIMSGKSGSTGISHARAVNSAYVRFWVDDRRIKLFTSQYLAFLIMGRDREASKNIIELFPIMKDRLDIGSPGEIFEADFLVNLEQCHSMAEAQRSVMGVHAQKVDVRLGVDISNNEVVYWPAGKLWKWPRNNGDVLSCQPMSHITHLESLWFVPEDKNQPFLDFFTLIPSAEDTVTWKVRVVQNTISKEHCTDLSQLKRVLMDIEQAGFILENTVDVAFVIERRDQTTVGSTIHEEQINVPILSDGPKQHHTVSSKEFIINVLRVLYKRTGLTL